MVNTSNVFGAYSLSFYNYSVDNSNGHNIPISISGTHVNTPDLILGPSARLVPATASDDASGVGGATHGVRLTETTGSNQIMAQVIHQIQLLVQ